MNPIHQLSAWRSTILVYLIFFNFLLSGACKKDNNRITYPVGTNENVNTWILDSLKRYYYWSESLPLKPDISRTPKDFFSSVRNTADRFSYIIIPNDASTAEPDIQSLYGFDYTIVQETTTGLVVGIVKLVLNDSPASRNDLKRGDYINKINGTKLTAANAGALEKELLSGTSVTLGIATIAGNSITDSHSTIITAGFSFEQPAVSKIIAPGNKNIGYLYVNGFNAGLASSLYQTFAGFKTAGIQELILDLRYNSGGQVAEAAGLSAMIAPSVTYDTPFIIYQGNRNGGKRTESIGSTATFDGTANFNTLLQNNIGLSRVYILGTAATASAAEVMINNLKPYMQVILIGEKTRGKDEASFNIYDARIPKQVEWEMHPIIYKLFNADGKGGYSEGITPDIAVNELLSLPLLSFGEIEDPLVKAAIKHITGQGTISATNLKRSPAINFSVATILTDTHKESADKSIVMTHR